MKCIPEELGLAEQATRTLARTRRAAKNTACAAVLDAAGNTWLGLDLVSRTSSVCAEPAAIAAAGGQRGFWFIDDSPQNAAAAADAGLRGIIATPEALDLLHANLQDIAAAGFDRMAETVLAPVAILDPR